MPESHLSRTVTYRLAEVCSLFIYALEERVTCTIEGCHMSKVSTPTTMSRFNDICQVHRRSWALIQNTPLTFIVSKHTVTFLSKS